MKSVIYADITDRTVHPDEQEILFDLNSLFKIISIDCDSPSKMWKIQLQSTEHDREDVEKYRQYIEEEMNESSPAIYFGWLLLDQLAQIDQAEAYFQIFLKRNHADVASVYNGIGRVYSVRNQFELALENYQIAFLIRQKVLPKDRLPVAASLHNIGNILREKEQFDLALEYLQQALQIEEIFYENDHLQKAVIIQNIANTLMEKGLFEEAEEKFSCAYQMFKRLLPEKHPKMSACLIDIGALYERKMDLSKALEYYYQAPEIDECCLPLDHPYRIKDFRHIAFAYRE